MQLHLKKITHNKVFMRIQSAYVFVRIITMYIIPASSKCTVKFASLEFLEPLILSNVL